jgi:hypothetical protein
VIRFSLCSFELSASVISQIISRIIEYLWCIYWRTLGKTGGIFESKRKSWVDSRVGYSIPLYVSFVWFCFPVETWCLDTCRFWAGLMLVSFMLPYTRNVRSRFRFLISPTVERYDMLGGHNKQLYTPANTRFMNNSHKFSHFYHLRLTTLRTACKFATLRHLDRSRDSKSLQLANGMRLDQLPRTTPFRHDGGC